MTGEVRRKVHRGATHLGATYEDLLRVADHKVAELVDGDLHTSPRPASRHALVPDLAGWQRDRMPEFPDEPAFTLAPDWICEVVSPSTERLDRAKKMAAYAREGVAHLWLLNPLSRTLEVYRLSDGRAGAPPYRCLLSPRAKIDAT